MPAYESFQSLVSFFRVSGCCPVRGLVLRHPRHLEYRRRSWYTVYSAFCLASASFTAIDAMVDSSSRRSLEAKLYVFFSIVMMAQSYIVFGAAVAGSPLLVSFLRQCAHLENRRPPPRSRQKSVGRLLRTLAVYGVFCSCMQCASRIVALLRSAGPCQIAYRFLALVGAFYIISWSMLAEAIVCLASQLIGIYIEVAANDLEKYGYSSEIKTSRSAEFLCEARITVRSLRQLFLTAEKFLSVPLLATFAAVMTNTCTMTFYMVTTEIHLGYLSKAMAVAYIVHAAFTLAVATAYARNVTEQAVKLKESLLTWTKTGVNRSLQKEVLSLLLHFKEESFTFNACGFFKVEPPIFRPMVGVVVTYTLVLYQTKLAALSWSPPPCTVEANSSLPPAHQSMHS